MLDAKAIDARTIDADLCASAYVVARRAEYWQAHRRPLTYEECVVDDPPVLDQAKFDRLFDVALTLACSVGIDEDDPPRLITADAIARGYLAAAVFHQQGRETPTAEEVEAFEVTDTAALERLLRAAYTLLVEVPGEDLFGKYLETALRGVDAYVRGPWQPSGRHLN